ncbi:MAG: hypothetical protein ACXVHX_25340, partial [Solirubrobacteraceae bacterium]
MAAIDMNVCEQAGTTTLSDRLDAAIPRQPDPNRRADDLTIRSNDLPVLRRPARLRRGRRYTFIAKGSQITARDPGGLSVQRVINLNAKLTTDHDITNNRRDNQRR